MTSLSPRAPLSALTALALLALQAPASAAVSTPLLDYWASNDTYGSVYINTSSPALGDFGANFDLGRQSKYWDYASRTLAPVTTQVDIKTNASPAGADPLYDLVTSGGQYGFAFNGIASATPGGLHTQMTVRSTDINGVAVPGSPNARLFGYASAHVSEQYLITSSTRPAGSYGALLVGITLEGSFAHSELGSAYTSLYASAQFTDSSDVNFESSFQVTASDTAWSQPWTGSQTVYKKLLFQYGTPFSLSLDQWTSVYDNGTADFSHTGQISSIEIPFASTLQTGAMQQGLGTLDSLYGHVFNSATADAQNTNWDFGSNGGGFTPPVPEPATYALMLGGLAAVALLSRRRLPRR